MTTPKWIRRGKNNTKLNTNLTVQVVKYRERKRNTYLVEFLLCIGRRYIHNRDLSIFFFFNILHSSCWHTGQSKKHYLENGNKYDL